MMEGRLLEVHSTCNVLGFEQWQCRQCLCIVLSCVSRLLNNNRIRSVNQSSNQQYQNLAKLGFHIVALVTVLCVLQDILTDVEHGKCRQVRQQCRLVFVVVAEDINKQSDHVRQSVQAMRHSNDQLKRIL